MTMLLLAAIAFVGTHFLLSHPLRAPLVRAMGERAFLGIYSVVAIVTLIWMVVAYRSAPQTVPVWSVGDGLWAVATVLMLIASILLAGSLVGNPAFPKAEAPSVAPRSPRGVYAVTRHPMLWSFAIWGFAHILVYPIAKTFIVTSDNHNLVSGWGRISGPEEGTAAARGMAGLGAPDELRPVRSYS